VSTANASTNPVVNARPVEGPLWKASASDLASSFERRTLSPVEVAQAVLERIATVGGRLNAFCFLDRDVVTTQAKESEARWAKAAPLSLLDGVPVSIKDNISANGTPTMFGSRAVDRDSAWSPDSPAVARLREAGAVILGKTCMPDFAHKLVTDSPLTGTTRNPWNLERSPGGSSGGAAAAVSAGCGPLALGTDGGGSIRIPAAWSGIYGFKPSFGRVPHYPRGPFAILSHVGPMTRTVRDAALVMSVISRPDSRDWYSLPPDHRCYESQLDGDVRGMKIAYSPTLGLVDADVDPEIVDALDAAAKALEDLGATVIPADPPAIAQLREVSSTMWVAFSARLARTLGAKRDVLDRSMLDLVAVGEQLPRDAFLEASIARGELGRKINEFFDGFDALLCPVYSTTAPAASRGHGELPLIPIFTSWCNQTGLPAASIPVRVSSSGLPIGVQLVGGRFADSKVLQISHAFEQWRGSLPWPPSFT
jgi:aspartyl-tRNA(Asn)/glutamyl-tRNA(Gln) amidotransferase subunit A